MTGLTTIKSLSAKQVAAIAALLSHRNEEEAARAAGVGVQTLRRWLKNDLAFQAAYRAAKQAEYDRCMARLWQGAPVAVANILRIACDGTAAPAHRMAAASFIIEAAKEALAIENFEADLAAVEKAAATAPPEDGRLSAGTYRSSPLAGHGSKIGRTGLKAIAALLTERSVADAARTSHMTTRTLYGWLEDVDFTAAYYKAALAVFEPTMTLLIRGLNNAVAVARNCSADPAVPNGTRLKASQYVCTQTLAATVENQMTRMAAMEAGGAGAGDERGRQSISIGSDLHQRLQRLKARFAPAPWAGQIEWVFVHAVDARAVGSSVIAPEGGHIWLEAPAGSLKGDPVPSAEESALHGEEA